MDNLDIKKLHYIQCSIAAFMPWYFTGNPPVSEDEMSLFKSLREKTSQNYEAILARMAEKYDFLVYEDDPYANLRFKGEAMTPMIAMPEASPPSFRLRRLVPLAALCCALITWFVTGQFMRAVTVLIVFCPCSFILATPTAVVAGIGNASRYGILIRSCANYRSLEEGDVRIAVRTHEENVQLIAALQEIYGHA